MPAGLHRRRGRRCPIPGAVSGAPAGRGAQRPHSPRIRLRQLPSEVEGFPPGDRAAVLTTTNGTRTVAAVASAPAVLIGCFLNAHACCQSALELSRRYSTDIGIVCAGEKGKFVLDDAFCAGYLVETLRLLAEKMVWKSPYPTPLRQPAGSINPTRTSWQPSRNPSAAGASKRSTAR